MGIYADAIKKKRKAGVSVDIGEKGGGIYASAIERREKSKTEKVSIESTKPSLGTRAKGFLKGLLFGGTKTIEETLEKKEELPTVRRSFIAGIGDLKRTVGATANWLGQEGLGTRLMKEGAQYQSIAVDPSKAAGEFDWKDMYDPSFYATTVARSVPFTLALMPTAIAGAYAGAATAGAIGLGAFGTTVLGSIGATSLSRPIESALEAGGVYDQQIAKGKSEEEADAAANKTFKRNLSLASMDATEFALAFAPTPKGSKPWVRALLKMAGITGNFLMEGFEELIQSKIGKSAQGEKFDVLSKESQEEFAIGGIMGAGHGVAGGMFNQLKGTVAETYSEEYQSEVSKNINKGDTEDVAEIKALDTITEKHPKQVAKLVENTVKNLSGISDAQVAALEAEEKIGEKIEPKKEIGEKLITVYHRTDVAPETVKKEGFKSRENTQEVFVSSFEKGQAEGYGKNVIELQVKESDLRLDDEFPSGEQHFAIKKEIADRLLQEKKPIAKKPVVVSRPKVKEISEERIKTTKDIKDTKSTLKQIRVELSGAIVEAEARAEIAQQQRVGVNVEDINKLKRIYANNKKFQEGDIETIRSSRTGGLLNRVVENVQEVHPQMSEDDAFQFALDLPTKAEESARTPTIRDLEKREKKLGSYLDLLKARQEELKIKADDELTREWSQALALQERLVKVVKVPKEQLPVGEGKEKVSRLQARLKGALRKLSQEDIDEMGLATYRQAQNDVQMEKVREYAKSNTEEAIKVAMGEVDPPSGMLQNAVWVALTEMGEFDTDLATKLASLRATRSGQEIQILKLLQPDNPVIMMQDIVQVRIEAYEKRTGNSASKRIKTEVNRIKKQTKFTTKEQWNTFIESIRC